MVDFPRDADGDVLRRLHKAGFDFGIPADVEFYCYAKDVEDAQGIADKMQGVGFRADVFKDDDSVSVYFKKRMLLTYDAVVAEQKIADQLLLPHATVCDGWMVGHMPDGANRKERT